MLRVIYQKKKNWELSFITCLIFFIGLLWSKKILILGWCLILQKEILFYFFVGALLGP
jgi:hypothetical protein